MGLKGTERNQRKKGVIKLANKINLSALASNRHQCRHTLALTLVSLAAVLLLLSALATSAQVPPRSEAAQEQREKETPLKDSTIVTESEFAVFRMANPSAHIQFQWEPLSIVFVTEEGKISTIIFTEDGVRYSGDVTFDESTKMFFDLFWKEYILEQYLKAKCEGQREE